LNFKTSNTDRRLKKRLILAAKLLVTAGLCGFIVWKADWRTIWQALTNSDPLLILVAFAGMILSVSISAFKWQILLKIHGEDFKFNQLHKYYFIAMFFNNFLPSNIGGDTYRIYKTLRSSSSKAAAVLAVFSERLTGMGALIVFGFLGGSVIILQASERMPELDMLIVVFGVIIAISFFGLVLSKHLIRWLLKRKKLPQKVRTLLEHLGDYQRHRNKTLQIIFISFFFYILTFSWMMVLIYAVGTDCDYFKLMVVVAISNLVAVLPISINGIGLMDGSFIYTMGKFGMDYNYALMVMLLIRALLIPLSLIGGFFYLKERQKLEIQKMREQRNQSLEKLTT
jgi:glycosyltransferase 2 family protein